MNQPEQLDQKPQFPGPLISTRMLKEDLMWYILLRAQECLQELDECGQVEEYFFWQIMELFCRRNGKMMMCEVATLLFKGYRLLRKKKSELRMNLDWRLPLAQLVFSFGPAPDDEHREAVIKMGDDLASRGLTYAAHICYVVAKVELGSRSQFELIGCERVPFGLTVLEEAFVRTETYEYVLSRTSGLAQPSFQLSCKLHEEEGEEPEWMMELRQLCNIKLADANLESQDSECCPMAGEIPAVLSPDVTDAAVFESRYTVVELLGNGSFSSVYAGVQNGKKTCEMPVEVVLMKMMSELPRCTSVVELLDWFEKPDHIIMVLEWPSPVWTSVKSLSFTTVVCLKHRLETSCCRWFRCLATAPLVV